MDSDFRPGEGRRKKFAFDKGRQLDVLALEEVKSLLVDRKIQRDHLIEYLHVLNDKFNCLYSKHLRALAEIMKLSMAEVFEVATFYAHFTVENDDNKNVPSLTIRVCDSVTCSLFGSEKLFNQIKEKYDGELQILKAPCMGQCDFAPALELGHRHVGNANIDKIDNLIKESNFSPEIPQYISYDEYKSNGGYSLYKNIKEGIISFEKFQPSILIMVPLHNLYISSCLSLVV